ncbi:MAG: SsrA-binding protein SmpB, partial [Patescibacteria group bacterium]|nr:SsrA-binding protein SmpB [Patescibacteria group bacterium]
EYTAGIVLSGAEVKSLRIGHANIKGAFITLKNNEAWLNNMQVTPTNNTASQLPEDLQTRPRKLLLKQKELGQLTQARVQGLTIIPIKVFTNGRYIKVLISTAKGKKTYDKRAKIKERDTTRDINRSIKFN